MKQLYTHINKILVANIIVIIVIPLLFQYCRKEIFISNEVVVDVLADETSTIRALYLLNEGNMGSNKATLDYLDIQKGKYHRNIYATANPSVPKELGDVGNDIAIYGNKLYAVINASNKVEVMDKFSAKRIGQIDIPNCRYIRFHNGFAYITSFAGAITINPNYEQIGYVAKVDTASLNIVATCNVGFQPEELEIVGDKIYVVNSGGYMFPNYDNTVSVIDINTFSEIKRIAVATNMNHIKKDMYGNLWVNARGDNNSNGNENSSLHWINTTDDSYGGEVDIKCDNFDICGDSLYSYSCFLNTVSMKNESDYNIVDVNVKSVVCYNFITDGTDANIKIPQGIIINPITKKIYITDAKNYVNSGSLHCYSPNGKHLWAVATGDVPASMVFFQ
ncbi:hypothetical protein FACS1894153_3200 [Bacteroidia bacterium]|nr:hypothetical protein FACS1894153_3200 [Bacteroidia bacterium]